MTPFAEERSRAPRDAVLIIEASEEQIDRLRRAAEAAGMEPSDFALQAALARAASELSEDYVTRISPEGMARWLQFQASAGSQRPARPREAAAAYEREAGRGLAVFGAPQPRLFDDALPPAPKLGSNEG